MSSRTDRRQKPYRRNRPDRIRFRLGLIAGTLATLVLLRAAAGSETALHFYKARIFPEIVYAQTSVTDPLPFSAAELLIGLAASCGMGVLFLLTYQISTRRRSFRSTFSAFLSLLSLAGMVLLMGYVSWGLNYAGSGLVDRLGWSETTHGVNDPQELTRLARQAVELTNQSYLDAFRTQDLEEPSSPRFGTEEIDRLLEDGLRQSASALGLDLRPLSLESRAKPILSSYVLCWLGISGFYFPWTGEANYNRLAPAPERMHSIAHEKAHQRGITSEDEANFVGFLATIFSSDPYLRYAGYLFAQVQLLGQLSRSDAQTAAGLVALRLPGVQRDREASLVFWQRFEGPAARVASRVNDTYLRAHGVEGGLESYSRSVRLLVLFSRKQGSLTP